ncbi:MAG TPA: FAD-dependent monooxygenase [Planctomycetota bacterium]|nr:FAD-dependent monooxygenase [Planctomycetota bacterium]
MPAPVVDSSRSDVCIVGGGPAGLLLGLLLAKRGSNVIVLEGHSTFDREFRGEVLQPSTARLLDEIGLLGYVREQPHLALTEGKLVVKGKVAGGFTFKRIAPGYPYALWMPQPVFLDALVRKAAPFTSFQCRMGARVEGLVEENGAVVGVRGVRHGKDPFEIRADVVVGADGRNSVVRRLGKFEMEYEEDDFDIIWFVVDPPPDWPKTIYFSVGSTPPLLMLPKYPDHIQVGLVFPKGEWRAWRKEGVPAVAKRLAKLSPLFAKFADGLKDFRPFFPLPAEISLVRDWARDGLLLIGDAAHTMSPAGAIGVNVALATAAVAAQVIHPQLGRGPIPRSALAKVQQLREADVRTLHRFQRRAGQILLGTGGRNPALRAFLQRGLPLVVRSRLFPLLQRRILFGVPLPPLDPGFRFE